MPDQRPTPDPHLLTPLRPTAIRVIAVEVAVVLALWVLGRVFGG